jgi:hypothetical protein
MIVTLEKLSPGELHSLTRIAPETDEGRRFKERVLGAVAVREYNGSGYVCVEVARP